MLKEARQWGEQHHPEASKQKHAAFANSVQYAMMRASGGFGGPSVRELAVTQALNDAGLMLLSFEEACKFCEPIVYGPLTDLHQKVWDEQQMLSYDNDPDDARQLERYRSN
jgi:hypothetical protein